MGIDVSDTKVVTINDGHGNGADTAADGTPARARFRGIPLVHVFSRNSRGDRRDDGNPLVHALKGRRGFSITPQSRELLMGRARDRLATVGFEGIDYVMPLPSSAPLCAEIAVMVAAAAQAPVLDPIFLRKRTVGEVLAQIRQDPPAVSRRSRIAYASQLKTWEATSPDAVYQAKNVNVHLRPLFDAFAVDGELPDLRGRRVLVVDDVFATGSSLSSVRAILAGRLGAEVSAVFLLSGL